MANGQSIDEIISKQAFEQQEKLKQNLRESNQLLVDNIVSASKLNDVIAKSKSYKEFQQSAKSAAIEVEKLNQAQLKTQLDAEKLATFKANEQRKEDARNAKLLADEEKKTAAINKQADAARKRAAIVSQSEPITGSSGGNTISSGSTVNASNIEAANAANQASTVTYNQNTSAVQKNTLSKKELALIEAQNKELARQNSLALKNQAKELNASKGSLDQRRAALTRLKSTFDGLNVAERQSAFGQRLSKVIPQLNEQVLTLEKSTGRAQRNVGNYTSAFSNGANKAFSAVKTLANILPGVGLAGLIGFAVEPIIEYVSQLDIFKEKISDTAKSAGAASSEYKKANSDIIALGTSISEFNNGTISKTELVNRFNESIGKTVGELKTAAEVEDFYNKKASAFVTATLLRAEANAALELSTQKTTEALERQISGPTFTDYVKSIGLSIVQSRALSFEAIKLNANLTKNEGAAKLKNDAKEFANLYDTLKKKADEFAKKNGLNFTTPGNNKKGVDPAIQARKDAAAVIQVQIDALKEAQSLYEEQFNQQNFGLENRLNGLKNYQDVSAQIIDLEAKKEIAAKKVSTEEILAIEAGAQKKQQDLAIKGADTVNKITREGLRRLNEIRIEQNLKDLESIEKDRDAEINALNESFAKGAISQENYAFRKEQIEKKYTDIYIALQIAQTQAYIDGLKARGENTDAEEAKLAALELKYSELRVTKGTDVNQKLIDKAKERFEIEKQLAMELFDLTKTLVGRSSELRLNALSDESAALDAKRNFDIEQVNDSVATEEDKANRIAIINAQSDAKQKVIDERVRQEKIRQAKAEKAAAIAQAIINGALAMTKVSAQTGILTFAFSPLIAALTAVQVAAIAAQPIPKYKHGKGANDSYSGMAVVGDGYEPELRIDGNGDVSLTPSVPTLTHVDANTQIVGGAELKRLISMSGQRDGNLDLKALAAEYKNGNQELNRNIKKIAVNSTIVTEKGFNKTRSDLNRYNAWKNNKFG